MELENVSNWNNFYRHFADISDEYSLIMNTGGKDIMSNPGTSIFWGGALPDIMYAQAGNDQLIGGAGCDVLIGTGVDAGLYGEAGNDFLLLGNSNNGAHAGEGDDHIIGGSGNNNIRAGVHRGRRQIRILPTVELINNPLCA